MSLKCLALIVFSIINPIFSNDSVLTYIGSYSDPKYPGMNRKIYPLPTDEDQVFIKGTDDGSSFWMVTAEPLDDTIIIDFSTNGGPIDLEGKWDGTGIVFPDGSKWTKITIETLTGLYLDAEHPDMERRIYAKESGPLTIKGTDDGNNFWTVTGKLKEDTIRMDFSSTGGLKDYSGKWDGTGLVFPDGKKWTKVLDSFVGYYFDPQDPHLVRQIYKDSEENKFVIKGTEDGSNYWTLPAEFTDEHLRIDITALGGPSDVDLKFDGASIQFPDGTKWYQLSSTAYVGSYIDLMHPSTPREIELDSSQMLKVQGSDDGQEFWELQASVEGMNINIDFSPIGGSEQVQGYWDGTGIVFSDSNKWIKKS